MKVYVVRKADLYFDYKMQVRDRDEILIVTANRTEACAVTVLNMLALVLRGLERKRDSFIDVMTWKQYCRTVFQKIYANAQEPIILYEILKWEMDEELAEGYDSASQYQRENVWLTEYDIAGDLVGASMTYEFDSQVFLSRLQQDFRHFFQKVGFTPPSS